MFGFRKKYSLPEDFFQGAHDIHCHLLPGVDDGFSSAEKSLYALKKLEERGVKKMILTPHFMNNYPENNRKNISAEFEVFKAEAEKAVQEQKDKKTAVIADYAKGNSVAAASHRASGAL